MNHRKYFHYFQLLTKNCLITYDNFYIKFLDSEKQIVTAKKYLQKYSEKLSLRRKVVLSAK